MFGKMKWFALVIGCLLILPCSVWGEQHDGETFYVTKILDLDVIDGRGETVGGVDDLVIRRNGLIKTATLEIGGWVLGVGGKVVGYPFAELTIEPNSVTVQETQEELDSRDEFDYFERGLPRGYYYGYYPPHAAPGYGPYRPGYRPYYNPRWEEREWRDRYPYEERRRLRPYPEIFSFSPARFLASVVVGRELIEPMGARFGRIRDLVIKDNRVEKIILETRVLEEDKHVALPYERIGFTHYGIVYEVTLDELEKMPAYEYKR